MSNANTDFFARIEIGAEIPELVKSVSTQQLVKWAGASKDFNQIHYDRDFAQKAGLPGVIVHGRLKAAFLGQLMTDWIGENGTLRKLSCTYRGMDFPGYDITVKGKVTAKSIEMGKRFLTCEVWTENSKGERTTLGEAVVALR